MVTFKWDDKRAREIAEEEGRADGLAEGRAEGLAQGMAQGLAEGRVEGRVEGRAEGMLRTLCSLVKDGILSNMDAAKRAGMSLEEFTKAIAML